MEQEQLSEVSIEDLPAEMVQMLLKNLDVPSLFACRLVCRKWNEMFTPNLHTRPETELFFYFSSKSRREKHPSKNKIWLMKGQSQESGFVEQKETVIQDFVDCVTQSGNSSPFARFALMNIQKWDDSFSNFLSVVSPIATCLKLSFAPEVVKEVTFIEKLRNLILHETPCLKEFGLGFEQEKHGCCGWIPAPRGKKQKVVKMALFPSRGKSSSSTKDPASILLPKLKVLHVGFLFEDECTVDIFRDILKIAPNLEKIQQLVCDPCDVVESPYCEPRHFSFFLDLGKLNVLKCVKFNPSSYFLPGWKNTLEKKKINSKEISSLFKLEDLELEFDQEPHSAQIKKKWMKGAFQLLEQILEGSKNSLEKLSIYDSVQFPRGFSFPTFTKLSTVKLRIYDQEEMAGPDSGSMFPAGCRFLNIFPNVKTLDLREFSHNLKDIFPDENSTPVMPTVHTILFQQEMIQVEDVEVMALLCPNLKKLKQVNIPGRIINNKEKRSYVIRDGLSDFPSFGRAVWTNMKNLESLHLIIDVDEEANAFPAIDSTFTGISKENCLRLFNESTDEDVQILDDDPEAKLRRESELKGLKVQESILDLPKLKELKISLQSRVGHCSDDEDAAYKACTEKALTQLSRVTQLYAFKLIPGFKCEIIGEACG